MSSAFFIGWDVGGWNCDKNGKSRDAIAILDARLSLVGRPWRGNLRDAINSATNSREWIAQLFGKCGVESPAPDAKCTLAIDTPLGFPSAFLALAMGAQPGGVIGVAASNPYLYRYTERALFRGNTGPLSAIKDMIGSQATKGMHALAKFAPHIERCGVWSDGEGLRAIEAYPAACRRFAADRDELNQLSPLGHGDLVDARVCALVAAMFARDAGSLHPPPPEVPIREGWIWVPKEGMIQELLTGRTRQV